MEERSNVKIVCRIKPLKRNATNVCISDVKETSVRVERVDSQGGSTFEFDNVLGTSVTQGQVYAVAAHNLVEGVLAGYDGALLCHGQTGSGKTFTLEGTLDLSTRGGVLPRAAVHITDTAALLTQVSISVSFVEIYLEKVHDLLTIVRYDERNPPPSLGIRAMEGRGPKVQGCCEVNVVTTNEILELARLGASNRHVAATKMNHISSRSHSIFSITISHVGADEGQAVSGTLHLVDLAGSERQMHSRAEGKTLNEARTINRSLSALGDVIVALTQVKRGQRDASHVPYRNSKLTLLLREAFGRSSNSVLILHVSAEEEYRGETVSTLRFGTCAMSVENAPRANIKAPPGLGKKEKQKLNALGDRLTGLRARLGALDSHVSTAIVATGADVQEALMNSHAVANESFENRSPMSRSSSQVSLMSRSPPTYLDVCRELDEDVLVQDLQTKLDMTLTSLDEQSALGEENFSEFCSQAVETPPAHERVVLPQSLMIGQAVETPPAHERVALPQSPMIEIREEANTAHDGLSPREDNYKDGDPIDFKASAAGGWQKGTYRAAYGYDKGHLWHVVKDNGGLSVFAMQIRRPQASLAPVSAASTATPQELRGTQQLQQAMHLSQLVVAAEATQAMAPVSSPGRSASKESVNLSVSNAPASSPASSGRAVCDRTEGAFAQVCSSARSRDSDGIYDFEMAPPSWQQSAQLESQQQHAQMAQAQAQSQAFSAAREALGHFHREHDRESTASAVPSEDLHVGSREKLEAVSVPFRDEKVREKVSFTDEQKTRSAGKPIGPPKANRLQSWENANDGPRAVVNRLQSWKEARGRASEETRPRALEENSEDAQLDSIGAKIKAIRAKLSNITSSVDTLARESSVDPIARDRDAPKSIQDTSDSFAHERYSSERMQDTSGLLARERNSPEAIKDTSPLLRDSDPISPERESSDAMSTQLESEATPSCVTDVDVPSRHNTGGAKNAAITKKKVKIIEMCQSPFLAKYVQSRGRSDPEHTSDQPHGLWKVNTSPGLKQIYKPQVARGRSPSQTGYRRGRSISPDR